MRYNFLVIFKDSNSKEWEALRNYFADSYTKALGKLARDCRRLECWEKIEIIETRFLGQDKYNVL